MANALNASSAAVRAADTLLRTAGRTVLLRLPAPAIPGDPTEQLGLAIPQFQDVELSPVVVLSGKTSGSQQLLVSATAVNIIVGSLGYSAARVLFAGAVGVMLDGVLLQIEAVAESEVNGTVYLYRLTLRLPTSLLT
jgi:hypothetical protein